MKNTINKIVAIEEKLAESYVSLDAKVAELQTNSGSSAAAEEAKALATTASTTAEAAQTAANNASAAASSAQSTANEAQSTANEAQSTAGEAYSIAQMADEMANTAQGRANQAYAKAEAIENSIENLSQLEFHNAEQKALAIQTLDKIITDLGTEA